MAPTQCTSAGESSGWRLRGHCSPAKLAESNWLSNFTTTFTFYAEEMAATPVFATSKESATGTENSADTVMGSWRSGRPEAACLALTEELVEDRGGAWHAQSVSITEVEHNLVHRQTSINIISSLTISTASPNTYILTTKNELWPVQQITVWLTLSIKSLLTAQRVLKIILGTDSTFWDFKITGKIQIKNMVQYITEKMNNINLYENNNRGWKSALFISESAGSIFWNEKTLVSHTEQMEWEHIGFRGKTYFEMNKKSFIIQKVKFSVCNKSGLVEGRFDERTKVLLDLND